MRLKDKTALVTGAANGMGAATARLLAEQGARVYVADRLADGGRQVARPSGRIRANVREKRHARILRQSAPR